MSTTVTCSQQWIRRFHPKPDRRMVLVALPHAGGSASYFHPLSAALGDDVEVLAVQYPGRQDRRHEALVPSVHDLADHIARALMPWAGPIALFGHSMGATVAYEVARRLQQCGSPAAALIVSARRAPSVERADGFHELDDDALLREVLLLGGSDAALALDEELLQLTLPVLRNDFRAVAAYRCTHTEPLTTPITALVGSDDPRVSVAEVGEWRRHTDEAFSLRVFDGGHFYLAEHAGAVIEVLRSTLEPHLSDVN
ncbi:MULTISPECIES: thioesterase II family protein [unclassified Streptomyces]|uniref:thioesterase II family protein n=1 Tax=unclassified Streptomyces TaxID=2593676 RepID=UPI0003674308|nr:MULTISPECIES: alpha/beta fold hydrolase [unclassified Streptomyces]MYX31049.1 alpha/beta fold hydrolase [Streptomyces sp. SID8381]